MTLFDPAPAVPVDRLEPVRIEVVRGCRFRDKPCRGCGRQPNAHTGKRKTIPGECDGLKAQRGCDRCGLPKNAQHHLGAPPSMNAWGRSGDGFKYMNIKDQWQAVFTSRLEEARLPKGLRRVYAEGEATFPDRARRDQGNFRVLIEKALGDALTKGGWLEDDDWSSYEFGNLTQVHEPGQAATRIVLFPVLEAPL